MGNFWHQQDKSFSNCYTWWIRQGASRHLFGRCACRRCAGRWQISCFTTLAFLGCSSASNSSTGQLPHPHSTRCKTSGQPNGDVRVLSSGWRRSSHLQEHIFATHLLSWNRFYSQSDEQPWETFRLGYEHTIADHWLRGQCRARSFGVIQRFRRLLRCGVQNFLGSGDGVSPKSTSISFHLKSPCTLPEALRIRGWVLVDPRCLERYSNRGFYKQLYTPDFQNVYHWGVYESSEITELGQNRSSDGVYGSPRSCSVKGCKAVILGNQKLYLIDCLFMNENLASYEYIQYRFRLVSIMWTQLLVISWRTFHGMPWASKCYVDQIWRRL